MSNVVKRGNYPSIFSSDWMDDIFQDFDLNFDKYFGNAMVVPYDVVDHMDKNGVVTSTEISYALAGYDKDNISIEVDDDVLTVKIDKTEEIEDNGKAYRHRGISKRRIDASYNIKGYDKNQITSSFENGVLKINLPVVAQEDRVVKKIEIKGLKKLDSPKVDKVD